MLVDGVDGLLQSSNCHLKRILFCFVLSCFILSLFLFSVWFCFLCNIFVSHTFLLVSSAKSSKIGRMGWDWVYSS